MTSSVCTLFEGHYHYGVAGLINSLFKNGFRGDVYAGYRGEAMPPWAINASSNEALRWDGAKSVEVLGGINVHFLPIKTDYHLAHYKPQFMLDLYNGPAANANAIAYFDPDIVIKCRWNFYENWMQHGVAMVHEITSNDMPSSHPIRREWESVAAKCNLTPVRKLQSYINSGFCGVSSNHIGFLYIWSKVVDTAIEYYNPNRDQFMSLDRTYPFYSIDQDAFNVAAMCCEVPISEIGPEGMDFIHGGWTMSHAVGSPKPWKKNFIWSALKGSPPSLADCRFWSYADGPLVYYPPMQVKVKRLSVSIGNFIGRFYRL